MTNRSDNAAQLDGYFYYSNFAIILTILWTKFTKTSLLNRDSTDFDVVGTKIA